MVRITYGITEEIYVLFGNHRVSYGIAAYSETETDPTLTIIASVRDVFSDKTQAECFAELCNRLKLDAVHLQEVVEDFLAQVS